MRRRIREGVTREGAASDHEAEVQMSADLVIRGRTVFDGSARRELGASGCAVVPGFIAIHTHSGALVVRQGR